MSVAVLDEIATATGGRVVPYTGIGGDWIDNWEPILDQVVEEEFALPEDLRVRFAAEIAEYLDAWADYDDDELMLWRARENFPKFLAMEPKIPDPRQKIPESA
jgi:hypothetical protein